VRSALGKSMEERALGRHLAPETKMPRSSPSKEGSLEGYLLPLSERLIGDSGCLKRLPTGTQATESGHPRHGNISAGNKKRGEKGDST